MAKRQVEEPDDQEEIDEEPDDIQDARDNIADLRGMLSKEKIDKNQLKLILYRLDLLEEFVDNVS